MKHILSKDSFNNEEIKISYSDYGRGTPVVLIHGWPLNKHMWEYQVSDLVNAGCRVIKYDRRGFGDSDKPWDGYDYNTLTNDLHELMEQLDLRHAVLVGFSMGGGEVVRYVSKYGTDRVKGIVLVSSVTPYLCKTDNNPDGVDESVFKEMKDKMKEDRISFLDGFGKKFFGVSVINKPVSKPLLDYYCMLESMASPRATEQCADSFANTDFRNDLEAINIPALVIHGDSDKTVPLEASGERTSKMIPDCQYKVYDGAPHGLFYTHKEELNKDLIEFIYNLETIETVASDNTNELYRQS